MDELSNVTRIDIDPSGDIVICGWTNNDFDLGTGTVSIQGDPVTYLAKFSPAGNNIWAQAYDCSPIFPGQFYYNRVQDMAQDSNGNLYLVGDKIGDMFLPGVDSLFSHGDSGEVFILKTDPLGNPLWTLGSKTPSFSSSYGVGVSQDGKEVYAMGVAGGSLMSMGGILINGNKDFLLRIDGDAGTITSYRTWSEHLGVTDLEVSSTGDLFLTGSFNYGGGALNMGNGVIMNWGASQGAEGGFLLAFDSTMVAQHAQTWYGGNATFSSFMEMNHTYDKVLVGGTYYLDMTIGPFSGTAVWSGQGYIAGLDITMPQDSVWPGDANNDLIADNNDLLAVGLAFGATGPARPNASIAWQAQAAFDWNDTIPGPVNMKYADTNGDGIVNQDDTLAINVNYGLMHNKGTTESATGVPVYTSFLQDSLMTGDTATILVNLGVDTAIAQQVYGLAFTLNYDTSLVDANSLQVTYGQSWLGQIGNDLIKLDKNFPANGEVDLALSRTNQMDLDGFGEICRINIIMVEDLTGKTVISEPFTVEITNVRIINAAGQEVEYNTSADTMILFTETVNSIASPFDREISVFPIPASTHLTVKSSGERMEEIALFDLNGKMIYQREISSQKHVVEVEGIPSGIYQMRITGTDHVTSRKILISQ